MIVDQDCSCFVMRYGYRVTRMIVDPNYLKSILFAFPRNA